jgi:lauroyl/myristoyl acyltransferase
MSTRSVHTELAKSTPPASAAAEVQLSSQSGAVQAGQKEKLLTPGDLYLLAVLALVKLALHLPFINAGEMLGRASAFTAFHLSRRKRHLAERSLSQVLGLSGAEMHRVLRGSFNCFWQDVFSPLPARAGRATRINAEFRGRRYLEEALARGKGVILWESSSLGRRFLAKSILCENGFPVCQVHDDSHMGEFHNPKSRMTAQLVKPLFDSHERRSLKDVLTLSRDDSLRFSRELLERLRRNEIICISADGRIGSKFVPITFLGRKDAFPTGIASLARTSGATILPLFCVEERPNLPSLSIESPIPMDQPGDREASVERAILQYISVAESYIRRYPEQYRAWNFGEGADH